jgi:integration host factor subunit beta
MVRSELILALSLKADFTHTKADEVVTAFFEEIVSALTTEGRVEIRGFGSFSVRRYRSYEGRNPKTGVVLTVPAKQLPFWKTGTELRQRVDGLGLGSGD